jgi:hypothetical protein
MTGGSISDPKSEIENRGFISAGRPFCFEFYWAEMNPDNSAHRWQVL